MESSYLTKHLIGTCVTLALLFISAGRLDYWQGWVYVLLSTCMLVLGYTVLRPGAELLSERSSPGSGVEGWDKKIVALLGIITLGMYVVAGLDSGRFFWSPDFSVWFTGVGVVLTASGQIIFLIAQKQNAFFSSLVRIQHDRQHAVCDRGLYATVRHPAYLGMCMQALGFPLLFGSLWSCIPVGVSIVLILLRTYWEDVMLQNDLAGYAAYAKRVRFRIVPNVW